MGKNKMLSKVKCQQLVLPAKLSPGEQPLSLKGEPCFWRPNKPEVKLRTRPLPAVRDILVLVCFFFSKIRNYKARVIAKFHLR